MVYPTGCGDLELGLCSISLDDTGVDAPPQPAAREVLSARGWGWLPHSKLDREILTDMINPGHCLILLCNSWFLLPTCLITAVSLDLL